MAGLTADRLASRWGGNAVTPIASVTVAAAGLVAVVAVVWHGPTVALVTAVPVVLVVWKYPKAATAFLAAAVLFSQTIAGVLTQSKLIDDAGILLVAGVIGVKYVVVPLRRPRFDCMAWFAAFVVLGALSCFVHEVPFTIATQDAYLLLKGLLFYFAVIQLEWRPKDVARLTRGGACAIVVILGAVVLNYLTGGWWFERFAIGGAASYRGGFAVPIGPFSHPGWLGEAAALACTALVAHTVVYGRSRASLFGIVATAITVVATLRRKAVVGLLTSTVTVLVNSRKTRLPTVAIVAILVPVAGIALWDTISSISAQTYAQYVQGASASPRTLLYTNSFALAKDSFPFGVGFGRFATFTAQEHYSPIYYALRLDRVYGLGPTGHYATDTFWPAIIGEAGWLGGVAYAGGLVALLRRAISLKRTSRANGGDQPLQFIALVAIGWWVDTLVESIAAPVYTAPPIYPLVFGALGVAVVLGRDSRRAPTYHGGMQR
jgi:hypothetical protein